MTDQEIDEIFFNRIDADKSGAFCLNRVAAREFARALLSRAIPEGHVVVPKEPTDDMGEAGYSAYRNTVYQGGWIKDIYRAMIAAAAPANKEGA